MARAQTANFWEMVLEIETSGGALPPPDVIASSVSNANPAVVTVGVDAITQFLDGDTVTIGGITTPGMTIANGSHVIGNVDNAAGTFELTGVDASAAASPATGGRIGVTPAIRAPGPVAVLSLSNANPAVVSVGTANIAQFTNGGTATIAGATGDMVAANGPHTVASINAGAGTFVLTGVDLSAALAPQTVGVTATPPAPVIVPLVWQRICGLTSRTVNRTSTMQTSEVPDCDDESLPSAIERSVQSSEVTVSGTGVWAGQSHEMMYSWWSGGKTKNIRIGTLAAPSGTVMYETGPAYLTQLNNTAAKGTKVTAEINVEFDGLPQVSYAP